MTHSAVLLTARRADPIRGERERLGCTIADLAPGTVNGRSGRGRSQMQERVLDARAHCPRPQRKRERLHSQSDVRVSRG